MEFEFSKKADSFQAGIFAILNEKKEEMVKAGKKVYNLSVGTPDFKPAPHIMEAVSEAAKDPENYKYALTDRPFLLEAVQNFYKRRFGVSIEPETAVSRCCQAIFDNPHHRIIPENFCFHICRNRIPADLKPQK